MTESPPAEFPPRPDDWPSGKTWPPGQGSLDDAFDKLRWAEHHFETLRVEIEPFEQRDAHTISVEVDADAGEYTFNVHGLEAPRNDDWGLMIGDCLHNARTALDYLMVRLFSLVTGDDPRTIERVEFPICTESEQFDPKSRSTARTVIEMRKHSAFSGYLARIEDLQPFNVGNPSVWGSHRNTGPVKTLYPWPVMHALPIALKRLAALDNLDKHRVIHATWLGPRTPEAFADPPFIPNDFEFRGAYHRQDALEDGAKVGSMTFATPLPFEWEPSQVEMKSYFPMQVSIQDELGFVGRVLEVLPLCLWGVESVLALFNPVFSQSKPPLPVTAIPSIPAPPH